MSRARNMNDYMQKAAMYSMLADYYKYQDPTLHVTFYYKHIRNFRKAIHSMAESHTTARPGSSMPGRLRFLHASADVDKVDIYLNGTRVHRNLDYKASSSHLQLIPGRYQVDIYPAGQSVSAVVSKKITVEPGRIYTSAIAGYSPKWRLITFSEQPYTPLGEAKARFIHLSPDAPSVDIAVQGRDVIFPEVSYKQATAYLGLTPMKITLEAKAASTHQVLMTIPDLVLEPNNAYTIVVTGTAGAEKPLEAIVLQG